MKKSYKIINLLFILIVFISVSCSEENWSVEEQNSFIDACRAEEGDKSYCNCLMKVTMEKFPIYETVQDIEFEEAVQLSIKCNE